MLQNLAPPLKGFIGEGDAKPLPVAVKAIALHPHQGSSEVFHSGLVSSSQYTENTAAPPIPFSNALVPVLN